MGFPYLILYIVLAHYRLTYLTYQLTDPESYGNNGATALTAT